MHATVLQENLHKALSVVTKMVSSRVQLPILANVLFEVTQGQLKVCATNLEITIVFFMGATDEMSGAFTVPAKLISELVASFPQDKITISKEQNFLLLNCGASEARITGIDAKEFPPLPTIIDKKEAVLKRQDLDNNLPTVLIAASTDESRPLLTGVQLSKEEKQTIMAATDGYRLSVKKIPFVSGLSSTIVVPAKAINEAYKLMVEQDTPDIGLCFSPDKNQVTFILPNTHITTKLIEGDYPKYERIIPDSFTARVRLNKDEMVKAVKTASIMARDSSNIVKFKLYRQRLEIGANSPQLGENKTVIEIELEGEEGEIAFNARFLLDLFANLSSPEVAFEMKGALSPGVFKIPQDDTFLHIIMPVRLQN